MEYGLRGVEQFSFDMDSVWVLILVLMEYGLRVSASDRTDLVAPS